jgi:hypothetical protein
MSASPKQWMGVAFLALTVSAQGALAAQQPPK